MVEVIHSAFGARPQVDPPSDADEETAETLAAQLRRGSGIFAQVDGRPAGYVTSAAYGFSVDAPIAYAWLPSDAAQPGQAVAIRYFGEAVPATVATDPLFDPEMARVRG